MAVDLQIYLAGEWADDTGNQARKLMSPVTGEHIANVPLASDADVARRRSRSRPPNGRHRLWNGVGVRRGGHTPVTSSAMDINTIDRGEVKAKIDRGDDFKLVMALNDFAFRAVRIPGSIQIATAEDLKSIRTKNADGTSEQLGFDDDIVVYCSDVACVGSQYAYKALVAAGFRNVRRYEGGLADWAEAGYPFEGEQAG